MQRASEGWSVLPVKTDGSKAPAVAWKQYASSPADLGQVINWFASGTYDGLGVVTGSVSGNLEMVELEGRAVAEGALEQLLTYASDNDLSDLLMRVMAGYVESTPSGGLHLLYYISDGCALRNTKLARTEAGEVLAESRGEGGFVVIAPSAGRTHDSGVGWVLDAGCAGVPVAISTDDRDRLWALLRLLDREPAREEYEPTTLGNYSGTRPGDDYANATTWQDILEPEGWRVAFKMGNGYAWTRPGKSHGISATTGQSTDGVDRLYVFSSSTIFQAERPYNKFSAYAVLHHGGDYSAAARALSEQGFGKPATIAIPPVIPPAIPPQADSSGAALSQNQQPQGDLETLILPSVDTLAQSEDGHSQALIATWGQDIRYCYQMGRWLHWTGSQWQVQPVGGGIVREFAKQIARGYPDDSEWRTFKKRALTTAGIAGALSMSMTDFRILVSIDELDAHPWELNTPEGIIDLRTGLMSESNPNKLHTKSTRFSPDFAADQGAWLAFLHTTFQGDTEVIDFIKRLMGYACVGEVREAILPVFYGEGANGKTVLLETVQGVLGDYATVAPQKFLVQGPSQHATEIAALAGARLVIASETNEGERFDEAKVKILTGGDKIKARFMRQDEFTFVPSHLLVMMTNHRPEVASGGTSFWRRLREVPFKHIMPADKRDPELKNRLIEQHGRAIMAWLAQGAAEYAQKGLIEPASVTQATKTYEASTDTVGRFVEDMCLLGGGEHVSVNYALVREAYEQWCRSEGETPVSTKALTSQLAGKFAVGRKKGAKGARFLTGISLVESATQVEAHVPPGSLAEQIGGR